MSIASLNLSDGQITAVMFQRDVVSVVVKDWAETTHTILFKNVLGVESYSPEMVDLSHVLTVSESEDINRVCSIVEEDVEGIVMYSFVSAWTGQSILNIFCDRVEISD